MQNLNILTQLQKQTIILNKEKIINLKHFKTIKKFLKEQGICNISQQELYDILNVKSKNFCEKLKFVSYSVGYSACAKGCPCYIKNLSAKITILKQQQDSAQKDITLKKRQNTVNKKYGVDNVSKLKSTKEKIKSTKKEKYGDENYRNNDKIIQTNLEKYGVDNPSKSLIVKDKISKNLKSTLYDRTIEKYKDLIVPLFTKTDYLNGCNDEWQCAVCNQLITGSIINGIVPRCLICFPHNVSKFEFEVRDYISTLIDPSLLTFNNRSIITPKELDIVIDHLKIAFECNGVYRHTEISGFKNKWYHLNKTQESKKMGYSLMHILDIDWHLSNNVIKSMIKHKLGLSNRIPARQTTVEIISNSQSVDFFNHNHLQGSVPAKITLGLIHNNEIVSAMSFSKSRFTKHADWELLRFCNKMEFSVVGAASKLLKNFCKTQKGSIITYADKSYGSLSFYDKIGFEFKGSTPPGYRYYKDGKLYSRLQFQKHKLSSVLNNFDINKTEWENMQNNGYDRIWDCGNWVYILKNN